MIPSVGGVNQKYTLRWKKLGDAGVMTFAEPLRFKGNRKYGYNSVGISPSLFQSGDLTQRIVDTGTVGDEHNPILLTEIVLPASKSQNFLVYQGGWTQKSFTTSVTYDLASNVLSQTYPSGRTVNYAYDAAGRTTDFTGNLGGTQRNYATGMQYTAAGLLTRETFGTTTALYHRMNYNVRQQMFAVRVGSDGNATYDVNPQAAGLTDYSGWGSSWDRGMLISHYGSAGATNDYSSWGTSGTNNNGNVLRSHHYIPGGIYVNDYEYDGLNRLKKDTGWGNANYAQAFDYDQWGNRKINQSLTTTSPDINKKDFTVDTATNRLGVPSGQSGTMSYDDVGNLILDTYTSALTAGMQYDADNKMTSAANGGQQYRYNADGKRVKRIIIGTGGSY